MRAGNASIKRVGIVCVVFALGLVTGGGFWRSVPSAHADPGKKAVCDQSSASGTWGYLAGGSAVGIGPVVSTGLVTCDATGHCIGSQTNTFNTLVSTITLTFDLTINSDCTGVGTITFTGGGPQGGTGHEAFVIVNDGTELDFTQTDPGKVYSGVAKRR
jgi:hypothetical protein